jgi:hypothetical protein
MSKLYNIYCDESCHLEYDKEPVMLLGCVWCPQSESKKYMAEIREIKNNNKARGELKWTKVSFSRKNYFIDIVDYFFSTRDINYRCLIVDNKSLLDHSYYNQGSHDSFYYKMYYYLLLNIIELENKYNIFLDIKDTKSQSKIYNLRDVLCNKLHDFDRKIIPNIQHVRSKELELLQLADFLTGAISYNCRKLSSNTAKIDVVNRISKFSKLDLMHSSPPWEKKFNLFFFSPRVEKNG